MPAWLRRSGVVALAALTLGSAALRAQGPPQVEGDSSPPPPRPIPADSIPDHARTAATILSGIRSRLPTDSAIARMDSALADIRARYAEREPPSARDRLDAIYYGELVDLHAALGQLQRRLDDWSAAAAVLAGRVEGPLDTLGRIRARWVATRESSWRALPAALREQVAGMLRLTDSVIGEVRPLRDRILSAQSDGARIAIELGTRIDEVQAAQDRARRQLLRQDSRPLWSRVRETGEGPPADSLRVEAPDQLDAALHYLSDHSGRLRLHLALLMLSVLAFWRMARQRDAWATAEFAMHWPSNLLAHPMAAGLVFALVFMRPLYPDAPQSLYALGFLVMLPALVTLLRALLDQRYRAPAYVLIGLNGVRVLAVALDWPHAAARIVLLGLAAVGAGTMAWLGRVAAREQRGWRGGWVLAQAGAALLVVAVIANAWGYVVLAGFLVSATLTTGIIALALIALADVLLGALLVGLFATPIGQMQVIRLNRDAVTRRLRALVRVAAVLFWISVALRQFQVLGPVRAGLGVFLGTPLTVGTWGFTVGEVLIFLVTLVVSVYVARGLRAVLRHDVLARMERGVPEAASSIVYYVTLALGVLFAAGAAGIEVGRLAIIAGALGVGIGFGLQTIVANFIAGLILLFERPVKPGDTLELEGLVGVVQAIGIRASTVRTFQGAEVIVPNQDLVAGRVINWTLSDRTRRVDVAVGVAYGTDPSKVVTILRDVVTTHPRVLSQPPPAVLFMKYGESSLDFEVRFWSGFDEWLEVRSDVLVAIYDALAAHGIEIPFPQRDLHIRSGLPAADSRPSASP
jgi:small-conductance mechanosensitive channel